MLRVGVNPCTDHLALCHYGQSILLLSSMPALHFLYDEINCSRPTNLRRMVILYFVVLFFYSTLGLVYAKYIFVFPSTISPESISEAQFCFISDIPMSALSADLFHSILPICRPSFGNCGASAHPSIYITHTSPYTFFVDRALPYTRSN
jgi:hypothetical protein